MVTIEQNAKTMARTLEITTRLPKAEPKNHRAELFDPSQNQ